jgi:SAM-dependent methyltransferase
MNDTYDIPISDFSFLRMGDEFIFVRCRRKTGYFYICPDDIIGWGKTQSFQIFIKKTSFDLYYPYIRFSCSPVDNKERREVFRHFVESHRVEPAKIDVLNPFPEFTLAKLPSSYSSEQLQPREFWEQPNLELDREEEIIRKHTLTVISRLLFPSAKIIDIACSTGIFLRTIISKNNGIKSVGCDISFPMCITTRKKKIPVVCCDSLRLPFLPAKFDLLVCRFLNQEVLPLFAVIPVVEECRRVLKPGGWACFLGYTKPYVNASILESSGFEVGNRILTTEDGIIPFYIARKRESMQSVKVFELFNYFPYNLFNNVEEIFNYDEEYQNDHSSISILKIKQT